MKDHFFEQDRDELRKEEEEKQIQEEEQRKQEQELFMKQREEFVQPSQENVAQVVSKQFDTKDIEPDVKAKTEVTVETLKTIRTILFKRKLIRMTVLYVIFSIFFLLMFSIDAAYTDGVGIIVGIFLMFVAYIIQFAYIFSKRFTGVQDEYDLYPNRVIYYKFYPHFISIRDTSQNAEKRFKVFRSLRKQLHYSPNYIVYECMNEFYPIDRKQIYGDESTIRNMSLTHNMHRKVVHRETDIKVVERFENMSVKAKKVFKILAWVTVVLTLLTIPFVYYLSDVLYGDSDNVFPGFNATWLYLAFIPIPMFTFIFGFILKGRNLPWVKNVIIGSVIAVSTFFMGMFGGMIQSMGELMDYSYVDDMETTIQYELPDTGQIVGLNTYTNLDGTNERISIVVFSDQSEIDQFTSSVETSPRWTNHLDTGLYTMLDSNALHYEDQNDYFMVYNVDTGQYNELPSEPGPAHIVVLEYNTDGMMHIFEYTMDVEIP